MHRDWPKSNSPLRDLLKTEALHYIGPASHCCSGFNDRKPPSRTITKIMDVSKAFDMVSHSFLIVMIGRYGIQHNLLKWIVPYFHGWKMTCLCQHLFWQQRGDPYESEPNNDSTSRVG